MKRFLWCVASVIVLTGHVAHAASQDGSVTGGSLVYENALQIFQNGLNQFVRGFVRLNQGMAVGAQALAYMDTNISVSGPIDLGETGEMILLNNLYTDGPITLTSGGYIKGKPSVSGGMGKTIFLGGDLTLSATTYSRELHITGDWSKSGTTGDLTIDGQGHVLNIQDRAQIFVDQNVTLTLRNMVIRTGPKSLYKPAIRLASPGSKLALDNVLFELGTDFKFQQGQLFIHDEVTVTGTSAFIYQSPVPSYITSGATWSFEPNTTFSVAPATYTDQPYTAGSATTNNFIVLADPSSALYLNGCTFSTTFTGLRLTQGTVLFDNRVSVNTQAGVDLASTTTTPVGYLGGATTGQGPEGVAWSPDGRFLVVVNSSSNTLQVYRLNASSVPPIPGSSESPTPVGGAVNTGSGSSPQSVAWSPDGRFLAVANGGSSNNTQVYQFNGSSAPTPVGSAVQLGSDPVSVAWSPDGRFFAVAVYESSWLLVYQFNGSSTPTLLGAGTGTGTSLFPNAVAWSPDGRFLAVVNLNSQASSSNTLQVYGFNGSSSPTLLGFVTAAPNSIGQSVAWSPDGRFIAALYNAYPYTMQVYSFNGSSTLTSIGSAGGTGNEPLSVTWSPDGRFLAVVNESDGTLQVSRFNGGVLGVVATGNASSSPNPYAVAWSPDGRFIALVNEGSNTLQVFYCNYYYTGQPSQAFSTGLLFSNHLLGSSYNATAKICGSARIEVNGMVSDDSP